MSENPSVAVICSNDHVRSRPGMYIGDTGPKGLTHLIVGTLRYACAEFLFNPNVNARVELKADGAAVIEGHGAWFPTEPIRSGSTGEMLNALDQACTSISHPNRHYPCYPVQIGVSPMVISALCRRFEISVVSDGHVWRRSYERGQSMEASDQATEGGDYTRVSISPDSQIFGDAKFDAAFLAPEMDKMACLLPTLSLALVDRRQEPAVVQRFHERDGVAAMAARVRDSHAATAFSHALHSINPAPIVFHGIAEDHEYRAALIWSIDMDTRIRLFVNLYPVILGSPLRALRSAIPRGVNAALKNLSNVTWDADQCFRGLTAAVALLVRKPNFCGNTLQQIDNPEVETFISEHLEHQLRASLEANQDVRSLLLHRLQVNG